MILQINEVIHQENEEDNHETETYIGEVEKVSFTDMCLRYTRRNVESEIDYTKGDLKQIFLLNNDGKTLKSVYGIASLKD